MILFYIYNVHISFGTPLSSCLIFQISIKYHTVLTRIRCLEQLRTIQWGRERVMIDYDNTSGVAIIAIICGT